jgi:hypothetical protein
MLNGPRDTAVVRLRALHEARARALVGVPPSASLVSAIRGAVENGVDAGLVREAIARLADAETLQWEIGTWSSGSGEGLSSMFEVRTLELARAWLHAALEPHDPAARAEALRLADEVEGDPNRVAASLSSHVAALRTRLGTPSR